MKKMMITLIVVSVFTPFTSFAAQNSAGSGKGGVSNIENQTKIFETTDRGQAKADWSKGRTIKPGESVQCWNPTLMRGGIQDPSCKK